jgi:broad specificity phosphatase PhoE
MHGRLDAPLSERGIQEAQQTANELRGRTFDVFYSSPTGRAMQTTQIIGAAVQVNKRKQLCAITKLSIQAVPTGLGFATRNYLGAQ